MARLAFVPWILLITSSWWLVRLVFHLLAIWDQENQNLWRDSQRQTNKHAEKDIQATEKGFQEVDVAGMSPKPWHSGKRMYYIEPVGLIIFVWLALTPGVLGAWNAKFYTLSLLTVAAAFLYVHAVMGDECYTTWPHKSRLDDIRIPLWSPFGHCMVYTLPARGHGLEAQITRKIKSEHKVLDKYQHLLGALDVVRDKFTLDECKSAMSKVVSERLRTLNAYNQEKEIQYLARWLYHPGENNNSSPREPTKDSSKELKDISKELKDSSKEPIKEKGQGLGSLKAAKWVPGASCIGRDVVMALLHCELLLFERRTELANRGDVWNLRSRNYSGPLYCRYEKDIAVVGDPEKENPGQKINAFKDAVWYAIRVVKQISNEKWEDGKCDDPLLTLNFKKPRRSVVKELNFEGLWFPFEDMYVERLWSLCWAADPSTFGALYLFLQVLYLDIGNDNRVHIAPLQPCAESKYDSEWRLRWRHLWQTALVCEILIMLPTITNSFFVAVASVV
ncbi:uncharacterized protein PV07_01971 [Cladophialophora immunda]|uniref:Uncharacterized protein n=1 Tax=Cladophialophora immunda TaxID=569365 RepID=A0A0D2BCK5_9EURO|nr:uncharacterized protein PV07_01971 [Cladophialophora immunda]KIW35267.1 hypothetical protein PV07_01971 [Cladophialophora immunda]